MTGRVCFCLCVVFVLVALDDESASVSCGRMTAEERIRETRSIVERTTSSVDGVIELIKAESVFSPEANRLLIWRLEIVNLEVRYRFSEQEMLMRRNESSSSSLAHPDLFAFRALRRYKTDIHETLTQSVQNLTDVPGGDEQRAATTAFLDGTSTLGDECLSRIDEEVNGHEREWSMVVGIFDGDSFVDDADRNDAGFVAARRRMDEILEDCRARHEANVRALTSLADARCGRIERRRSETADAP